MKTVAILGGGPSGAHAAEKLAAQGVKTIVFDEKLAWEKPCGGGVTYKAYDKYPYLAGEATAHKSVTECVIASPGAGEGKLTLRKPLRIYARKDLNALLLKRAERAGAAIEQTRVLEIERQSEAWRIRTQRGVVAADFCVVATGARNNLKNAGTALTASDAMLALGYYVPGSAREQVDIQFLKGLEGYIWVFPRHDHLSVGICGKGETAARLRARLELYMREHGLPVEGSTFYAHVIPSLESAGWRKNRLAGEGWLAVGDAGGLVDPITGEGIYYALRSSDLAAQVLLDPQVANKPEAYRARVQEDFMADLAFGATLARRVFLGRLLFTSVPDAMVKFLRRSRRFHDILHDLFAGTQPYLDLKERLVANVNGPFQEVLLNFFFSRLLPNVK